jgi:hypothetical protein
MQNQTPLPKPDTVEEPADEGLGETACCAYLGACESPAWNLWHGEPLCKAHWYEKFDAHYAAESKRRWCPFCGCESVVSDAPREMFEDMEDDDDPMTCAGDCYIQGVSIPRSEWPILMSVNVDASPPH